MVAGDALTRDRWSLVGGMALVVFMATLDTSVVAVALPAMERGFGVRTAATEWVVLGYLLPLVAFTLPAGRWLDQVGSRPALLFGVAGFTLSSLAAGAAPVLADVVSADGAAGLLVLVAARVVQGGFAGTLFALIPMIVTRAVGPERAGRASALVMTLGPLGALSGPALGGLIVGAWGWPWIFYLNVPAGMLVIAIVLTRLPRSAAEVLRRPDRSFLAETALLSGAAGSLLLGLSLGASHGVVWFVLVLLAIPFVSVWWGREASAPFRALMLVDDARWPVVLVLLNAIAISVVEFLAPFFLQRVLGLPAVAAGTAILAFPGGMVLAGPVGGLLADRWGAARTALLGVLVTTLGTLLLLPLADGWSPADLSWRLGIAGAGTGLFAGPVFSLVMAGAPAELAGMAGAAQSLARQVGFSLGPALATASWALSGYSVDGMRAGLAIAASTGALGVLILWRAGSGRNRAPVAGEEA